MALKLRNTWKYDGDDWWAWEAFIEGTKKELQDVSYVEYILHPTFPEPVRRIDNPNGGFVLETGGWGEFNLKAFVHMKNGSKKKLTHDIQLEYDPKKGVSK